MILKTVCQPVGRQHFARPWGHLGREELDFPWIPQNNLAGYRQSERGKWTSLTTWKWKQRRGQRPTRWTRQTTARNDCRYTCIISLYTTSLHPLLLSIPRPLLLSSASQAIILPSTPSTASSLPQATASCRLVGRPVGRRSKWNFCAQFLRFRRWLDFRRSKAHRRREIAYEMRWTKDGQKLARPASAAVYPSVSARLVVRLCSVVPK